jgi:hypothetical protein
MAVINLDLLKTYFETYDKPTEEQFADLIDTLSTTIRIVTYTVSGTGDVWTDANSTIQIVHDQKKLMVIYHNGITYLFDAPLGTYAIGGVFTHESNYVNLVESQFTNSQVEQLLALIADDITVTSSLTLDFFEKGVKTTVDYVATIDYGDAVISSIKLNGIPFAISPSGNSTINYSQNLVDGKIYNLIINYTLNSQIRTYNETIEVVAYAPQFSGLSNITDYTNALTTNIVLSKYIIDGSDISFDGILNDSYLWFIVGEEDSRVIDQNGLEFTDGTWVSNEYFIKKTSFITLEDGALEPVVFYRSLEKLNSKNRNYKFEIN